MSLKRFPFFVCFVLSITGVQAQKAELLNSNVEDFPDVQLRFQFRSPQMLDSSRLKIRENGERLESFSINNKKDSSPYRNKQLVILIENSYHSRFAVQREKVKSLWSEIAGQVIQPEDEIIVADFDWDKEDEVLNVHNDDPSGDPEFIHNLISDIESPKNDGREHKSTEIFPALMRSFKLLERLPKSDSTARAVLLFSSEFNNIYNNVQTKSDVIIAAREADIPVYCFRYPYSSKYNLKDVAEKTYGRQIMPDSAEIDSIVDFINSIPEDYGGRFYDLSFKSDIKADGSYRTLEFAVTAEESFELKYQSPSAVDVFLSKRRNVYFLVVAGIIAGALLIWGIRLFAANRKKKEEELKGIREETEKTVRESEERLNKEREDFEQKTQNEKEREFNEELLNRFRQLPRYPKLVRANGEVYEITKPVFYIGRASDNDLPLDSKTVSKKHAVILYDHRPGKLELLGQNKFIIADLDSTNGTLLNERPIARTARPDQIEFLNHNDFIKAGEVNLTFIE